MTIATTTATVTYAGTSSDSALATTFPFVDEDDLIVTQRVTATGVETTMVKGTDYTVTGGGAGGATGTVQIASGVGTTKFQTGVHTWTISRDTTLTQSTDYVSNDNFPAESHEDALDKLTLIAQDLGFSVDRSLKVPLSDDTSLSTEIPDSVTRASGYLGFNASGVPVALAAPTTTSITTPFSLTLLDDANPAEARGTLGSTTIGDALFIAASAAAARTTLLVDGNVQGKSPTVQVFTTPGANTYTKPAGIVAVVVEVVGGGGGSGGSAATTTEIAAAGGAGGGGYARKFVLAGSVGATETVTIGAGGAAGTAGANTGGTGGTSSFGAHASATGGNGSIGGVASSSDFFISSGASGGSGSGGDVNIAGSTGNTAAGNATAGNSFSGGGGGSVLGGARGNVNPGTGQSTGGAGVAYGGGASGSANSTSESAVAGSAGAAGIVIVWEFY